MARLKRSDLGPLINTYRGRPLRWRDLLLVFLIGTFAVFFPLVYGVWINNIISLRNGPIAASSWSGPWFILAVISTLCLLLLALIRVFHATIYVSTFKNGLEIKLSPIRRHIMAWTDIFEITNHSLTRHIFGHNVQTKFRIELLSKKKKTIRLDQKITHVTKLAYEIKKYSFQRLFPSLVNDFQSGRWLDFGPLSINKHYISTEHEKVSWSEVSRVYIKAGNMFIETWDEQNIRIKTSQIPNIELLFKLISRGIDK